ncbi:MAG TPA: hypothetical protein VKB60_02530 [Terriglobales bacterium]|nr:hypothetical protein [Terriglobales bacterium]
MKKKQAALRMTSIKKKAAEHARCFTSEAVQHDTLLRKMPRRWLRHPGASSSTSQGGSQANRPAALKMTVA